MKYAIMSDAHANPQALETALRDARKRGCERYFLLGDVTGYGYDVKRTLKLVRKNFDVVLMGNHDSVCLGLEPRFEVLFNRNYDIDRAERDELTVDETKWLRSRKYIHEMKGAVFTHGDLTRPSAWKYIMSTDIAIDNFAMMSEPLLFCGHTHHATLWTLTEREVEVDEFDEALSRPALKPETMFACRLKEDGRYIVNVGSVGYPRNDLCSVYVIYDDETRRLAYRRLPFDFKGYIQGMIDRKIKLPLWLCDLLQDVH